jgi:hypothetical protein
VQDLSVDVINSDSGQPLQTIPLQNGDEGWHYWMLKLDKSVAHIQVIARDEGSKWGQWLAIATPSECDNVPGKQ